MKYREPLICGLAGAVCGLASGFALALVPTLRVLFTSWPGLVPIAITSGIVAAWFRKGIAQSRGWATVSLATRILFVNIALFLPLCGIFGHFSQPSGPYSLASSVGTTILFGLWMAVNLLPVLIPLAVVSHLAVRFAFQQVSQ